MTDIQLKRTPTTVSMAASTYVARVGEPLAVIETGEVRIGNGADIPSALPSATANAASVVNVISKGADASGASSSRAAVVSALAAVKEGGAVYFPEGAYTWADESPVVVTKARVTLTGPGIINGRFKIGDGSTRLDLGVRIRDLRFVRALDKTAYPTKGYADGSYFIGIDRVRDVTIEGCEFYGAAWPIFVMPNAAAGSHDTSMVRVLNNRFGECDWAFYSTFHASSTWQALADSYFINNVVNRSYVGMFYAQGIDGAHVSGNVHFMINYGSTGNPRFPEKQQNIRIDWSDWLHIADNNLFEAGTESVLLTNARTLNITGNNIAWSGQRAMSSAIDVTAGSGEYAQATITGNNVQYYSKHAIRLAGNFGELQLGPNPVRYSATSTYYVGNLDPTTKAATHLPALSGVNHYRYDLSGVTGLVAAQISVLDGTIAKTGHYDVYPGHPYLQSLCALGPWQVMGSVFRAPTSFAALTEQSILSLKDVTEATTTYQGELSITAKYGSNNTSKTTFYKLLVSQTPADRSVLEVGRLGYSDGASATDPSFDWSISTSNALVATPIGQTAGSFTFSVVFTGNILVG